MDKNSWVLWIHFNFKVFRKYTIMIKIEFKPLLTQINAHMHRLQQIWRHTLGRHDIWSRGIWEPMRFVVSWHLRFVIPYDALSCVNIILPWCPFWNLKTLGPIYFYNMDKKKAKVVFVQVLEWHLSSESWENFIFTLLTVYYESCEF